MVLVTEPVLHDDSSVWIFLAIILVPTAGIATIVCLKRHIQGAIKLHQEGRKKDVQLLSGIWVAMAVGIVVGLLFFAVSGVSFATSFVTPVLATGPGNPVKTPMLWAAGIWTWVGWLLMLFIAQGAAHEHLSARVPEDVKAGRPVHRTKEEEEEEQKKVPAQSMYILLTLGLLWGLTGGVSIIITLA